MDAINKIYEFQKFGSVLGLERMTKLMEILGDPQDHLKFIHVAGTNGKGSVCRYIYHMIRKGGYKVGIYTSPFLEVFNERIEFDGNLITDSELSKYTELVLDATSKMKDMGFDSPTEFEIITAIAFLYYYDKKAEYVVLEVGLGGRGDATNIIKDPLVSVITSISFDHTEILGDTLEKIAFEKAGIIKDGCPVITSAKDDEAVAMIEKKAQEHDSFFFETRNLPYEIVKKDLNGYEFNVDISGVLYNSIKLSMLGEYQVENAILALSTIDLLIENHDIKLTRHEIYQGLYEATNIGRFEVMSRNPLVIIDGAHNPDGALSLRRTASDLLKGQNILMVVGMLKDKDTDGALKELTAVANRFIVTEVPSDRKMTASDFGKKLEKYNKPYVLIENYEDAVKKAMSIAKEYDAVIFAGSLYLIGALRPLLH